MVKHTLRRGQLTRCTRSENVTYIILAIYGYLNTSARINRIFRSAIVSIVSTKAFLPSFSTTDSKNREYSNTILPNALSGLDSSLFHDN